MTAFGRPGGRVVVLAVLVTIVALPACSANPNGGAPIDASRDDAVTVASFDFAESELLAEVYSQTLEGGGYEVERAFGLGPRELVAPALADGLVELVPEYAGTALQFVSLGTEAPARDAPTTHAALVDRLEGTDITALAPAPAQNANAFVVTRATAERHDLAALSDLAAVASELTFAGPPECTTRPLCLVGLEEVYGSSFGEVVSLDAGGPLSRQAITSGAVDVALLFTTDPAIATERLVELVDDRGLQPAENITPLVRTEVLERWGPDIAERIDAVSRHLTTEVVRDLNDQVANGEPAAVAADWLDAEGLA